MANSVNKNTQNVRKMSTTGQAGSAAKGSANPKKGKRKMKKQARRTIAGLLLASAVVVAAIPTPDVRANNNGDTVHWVKALNYTSNISAVGAWENTPSGEGAIEEWKSYVPKVDTDITKYPIYTTSTTNNSVQYRFAFVPSEHGSGTNVAVILGANTSKVKDNTLAIDEYVDAFKKYSYNTSTTNFCAVSMDDSFLYYPSQTQRKNGTQGYYKVVNNDYDPLGKDATYGDIIDGYNYVKPSAGTKPTTSDVPTGPDEVWPNYEYVKETAKYNSASGERTLDVEIINYISESYEEVVDDETVTKYRWVENNVPSTYLLEPSMLPGMAPCYDSTEDTWAVLSDSELYYWNSAGDVDLTAVDKFEIAGSNSNKQRIHDVEVWYIGQQHVEETEDGVWKIVSGVGDANPGDGVFAGLTNVTNLILPSTLQGVGDYAFYGCNIKSVRFDESGSIRTIGNSAFANCIGLEEVYIPLYSSIKVIGESAFYNDYSINRFTIPTSIYAIGDYAFKNCSGLQYVDFTSQGNANYLNAIGYHAFENCTSLTSLVFPEKFLQDSAGLPDDIKKKVPINTFIGCTNIESITIQNKDLDIADGLDPTEAESTNHGYRENPVSGHDDCDIDLWIDSLNPNIKESFYFEGYPSSAWAIYQTAQDHCLSYKHLGEEIYERVVECNENPKHSNTFMIDRDGQIIEMKIDSKCSEVRIPERIGKIGITTLSGTSFNGNCNLKRVYIPNSVKVIETGAFKGCHQLEAVIFTQPENPDLVIQEKAFDTQNVSMHQTDCSTNKELDTTPFLSFVGSISENSAPFNYAMNPSNNINIGSQTAHTYIYYFSGWPTNLTVKYDYDTDKNTLIDVPQYDELSDIENKKIKVRVPGGAPREYKLPYLDEEMIKASKEAVTHYQQYIGNPKEYDAPTQNEYDIINSALNIVLPSGIEAIQTGLFSMLDTEGKLLEDETVWKPNKMVQTVTTYTVEDIEPYAFAGCYNDDSSKQKYSPGLQGFYQPGNGAATIGSYAFRNCTALDSVEIGNTVNEIGLRPFMGCDNLLGVSFGENPNFTCSNSIIYGVEGGQKAKILECLECRGKTSGNAKVGPDELSEVTSMAEEAFMDCDGIGQVDLSTSSLGKVSERAFALTDGLGTVMLPDGCKSIGRGAFWNTALYYIEVPDSVTLIQPEAFANVKTTDKYQDITCQPDQYIIYQPNGDPEYKDQTGSGHKTITAYCVEGSAMDTYAEDYYYINPEYYRPTIYHNVYFWDTYYSTDNPDLIDTQKVEDGMDAVPPPFPQHEGETANAWTPNYTSIVRDTDVTTVYGSDIFEIKFMCGYCGEVLDTQYVEYEKNATLPKDSLHDHSLENVYFKEWVGTYLGVRSDGTVVARYVNPGEADTHVVKFFDDGNLISTQNIADGSPATAPMPKGKSGYTFVRWTPSDFTAVTEDMTIVAEYAKDAPPGPVPQPTSSGSPSPSSSSSASPSPSPTDGKNDNNGEATKYTVTVSGGSGSGSYPAGAIVGINAYDMGTGQTFDKWTTSTAGVGFADATSTSTFFTMPAANVAITATYKTGGADNNNQGGNNNGGNGNGGNNGNTSNPSGTRVDINKNGISNKGVAGATVSGSTDNFVVKITDDASAAQLAQTALQNAFGANFADIKYFPFDISLYDESGTTKIADTSGMSVNITMPLPDELATYAGNNKVASVLGGELEPLNSRFTTVDGVPCISFTATHFSPYVIYVDTKNLTESTIDYTPKTGDPIHPKWFLAIGLAAISLILFFKKDKRVPLKAA